MMRQVSSPVRRRAGRKGRKNGPRSQPILLQHIVPHGELMVLGSRFYGGHFGVQPTVDLGRGLRAGVVEVKRMQRE
jgi:hypothetical protein